MVDGICGVNAQVDQTAAAVSRNATPFDMMKKCSLSGIAIREHSKMLLTVVSRCGER